MMKHFLVVSVASILGFAACHSKTETSQVNNMVVETSGKTYRYSGKKFRLSANSMVVRSECQAGVPTSAENCTLNTVEVFHSVLAYEAKLDFRAEVKGLEDAQKAIYDSAAYSNATSRADSLQKNIVTTSDTLSKANAALDKLQDDLQGIAETREALQLAAQTADNNQKMNALNQQFTTTQSQIAAKKTEVATLASSLAGLKAELEKLNGPLTQYNDLQAKKNALNDLMKKIDSIIKDYMMNATAPFDFKVAKEPAIDAINKAFDSIASQQTTRDKWVGKFADTEGTLYTLKESNFTGFEGVVVIRGSSGQGEFFISGSYLFGMAEDKSPQFKLLDNGSLLDLDLNKKAIRLPNQ